MKAQDRHIEAVEQMLKYINEHGGDDAFIERYLDHAEQALLDLVVAADDPKRPPRLETMKGKRYYARDSDGQWYYMNHAIEWHTCPAPI